MIQSASMFVEEVEVSPVSVESNLNFNVGELFWSVEQKTDSLLYQQITFKVSRNPKLLIAHIQRIYFTYNKKWADQLYAALTDLCFILNGKENKLSKRMVMSTRSLLSKQQCQQLDHYFSDDDKTLLIGNKFSILTQGLIGSTQMIKKIEKITETHDPLLIARDFVEYSQLEDAKRVLETGIIEEPERLELQNDLIELYQLTSDREAFTKTYEILVNKKSVLSSQWQTAEEHFSKVEL